VGSGGRIPSLWASLSGQAWRVDVHGTATRHDSRRALSNPSVRSAVISNSAIGAVMSATLITPAPTATAQSVNRSPAPSGLRIVARNFSIPSISTWCSPCRNRSPPSPIRTSERSTVFCSAPRPRPYATHHRRRSPAPGCRDRLFRRAPHVGAEPASEPSLMMHGIIISFVFSEQRRLILRTAPV
jgi:hypothetical protein